MLLDVRHLAKHYGTESPVFHDVLFHLDAGESLAVLGSSGCGKSSLLNCLGGLDRPTSGTVLLQGQDLADLDTDACAALRAERIGFVFQEHHLLPQLSALENIVLPTLALRAPRTATDNEQAARELLKQVGLEGKAHLRPAQLSGGERQRVALARALINRPVLVLADEPTGSLDQANALLITDLLIDLNRRFGTALVVVTHAANVAARMSRSLTFAAGTLHEQIPHAS